MSEQTPESVHQHHRPYGIYDECGHTHQEGEAGTQAVDDVGIVCEAGLQYQVCFACHTDDGEVHERTPEENAWPCDVEVVWQALAEARRVKREAEAKLAAAEKRIAELLPQTLIAAVVIAELKKDLAKLTERNRKLEAALRGQGPFGHSCGKGDNEGPPENCPGCICERLLSPPRTRRRHEPPRELP